MAEVGRAAAELELARLNAEVEGWRRTRVKLSPMPAGLWVAAVAAAKRLGVNRVKDELGLNYGVLKKKVQECDERAASKRSPGGGFVELSGAQVLGLQGAVGTVVELVDAGGVRLTVKLVAGAECDVARLVAEFRKPAA